MRLLSSEDEDVQFYSCAALSNLAVHSSIRIALTQEQDGLIFNALIRLLSSRSEKVIYIFYISTRHYLVHGSTN